MQKRQFINFCLFAQHLFSLKEIHSLVLLSPRIRLERVLPNIFNRAATLRNLDFELCPLLFRDPGNVCSQCFPKFSPHAFHLEYKIEVFAAEGVTKSQITMSLEAKNTALGTEFEMCVKFQIMPLNNVVSWSEAAPNLQVTRSAEFQKIQPTCLSS